MTHSIMSPEIIFVEGFAGFAFIVTNPCLIECCINVLEKSGNLFDKNISTLRLSKSATNSNPFS